MAVRTGLAEPTFLHPSAMTWAIVSEVYWMSWKVLERRLYALDLSASQARVLAILYFANRPMRPSVVATLLFQESQSITGTIHRIEERGLVERKPDPSDNRAVGLALTASGRRVAREVIDISRALYMELFDASFSAQERRRLEVSLKKVRTAGFRLPEVDFKLERAQEHKIWRE